MSTREQELEREVAALKQLLRIKHLKYRLLMAKYQQFRKEAAAAIDPFGTT